MIRKICCAIALVLVARSAAADWPSWRGPRGDGYSMERGFPTRWSGEENIKWRVPLPAAGNSTPIVVGDRVLVTIASEDGSRRSLLAFNRLNGEKQWEKTVEYAQTEATHETNPQCSSSPVSDGERVVVWYGSAGVHCYDLAGTLIWSKDLGRFDHIWGTGSSPLIFENLVILNCGPGLRAFVVALDKQTGAEAWRFEPEQAKSKKADEYRGSWSTPVVFDDGGVPTVMLSLPMTLYGLDPRTGDVRWWCDGLSELVYPSPVVGEDTVVAMSGYHGPAMAVAGGGTGNVTNSHRLWRHADRSQILQRVGSGIIVDGHIYIVNEPGIAWCMDLEDGSIRWKQRLGTGSFFSSMCFADGRLYVVSNGGTTFVLEPDPEQCKILAENPLGELTRGSLAFSSGQIFVHTAFGLYAIEQSDTDVRPAGRGGSP